MTKLNHCNSVDGPVAEAVQKALDNGNLNRQDRRKPKYVRHLRSRAKCVASAPTQGRSRTRPSWRRSYAYIVLAKALRIRG